MQGDERPHTDWAARIEEQLGKDTGLVRTIVQLFRPELSGIHGVDHWLRVYSNGLSLAQLTGADCNVIKWFALLHDSCRRFDGSDREHGPRAAAFAREHQAEIDLHDTAFGLLESAIACHTTGCSPTADITVRTCLDADRLDIGRVGLRINPRLLYTDAARAEAQRRRNA
jgi:uncharacterized protein